MVRLPSVAALALVLAAGLPAAGVAQTPTQTESAAELLEVMKMDDAIRDATMMSVEMQVEVNPALAPFRDVMSEFVDKYLTWQAMKPDLIQLYAESFSEQELRELIAFYKTPTGQKTIALLPDLTRKGAEIGARLMERHGQELQQMIQQRVQELQQEEDVN